jgi:hypothetical protein
VDLNKIVELLEHYPPWFRWSIATWVLLGALILVGFLTLRQLKQGTPSVPDLPPRDPPQSTTTTSKPSIAQASTPLPPQSQTPTFEEYIGRLQSLADRFLERQEFINSVSGMTVAWEGIVGQVTENPGDAPRLSMIIESSSRKGAKSAFVTLPNALRTKAFSLRKGDTVLVVGKLTLSTPNFPEIEATDLTLVRAKGG